MSDAGAERGLVQPERSGTPDLPRPVAKLVERLAGTTGVAAVVLGGSRATGRATRQSDWDLGLYYRGVPDLEPLHELGDVHPPGSWGRLMNGGAWLSLEELRIDVLLRDLDTVEHWTSEAQHGRYAVDGLLGYLAGLPTYTLTAEVASSIVLTGRLPVHTAYPADLARVGPERWRFHRDFSLSHAARAAELGNEPVALGQLARAMVEEAHARHCAARRWVLNEKRIFDGTDLAPSLPRVPAGGLTALVEATRDLLRS
ncbi:MAG TPA: nucleotidyltransferase domain-containing protein [Microlunatus sp.]|nr:nucleotidyltransferase domain-containing protein [Microlunatus sp.]